MSGQPITSPSEYLDPTERCVVENRGANFGKLYVLRADESIEAILLWSCAKKGQVRISTPGVIEPNREQKARAIRALRSSPWGEFCFDMAPESKPLPPPPLVPQTVPVPPPS